MYRPDVLRRPTAADLDRLLDEGFGGGWPAAGCLGSFDSMRVCWKNCPAAWSGMFRGRKGAATIVMEAIADHQCRFWHFFAGFPASFNEINVLGWPTLLDTSSQGSHPRLPSKSTSMSTPSRTISSTGHMVPNTYACSVPMISEPGTRAEKLFVSKQESQRKDVERAFGILQRRWRILTTVPIHSHVPIDKVQAPSSSAEPLKGFLPTR